MRIYYERSVIRRIILRISIRGGSSELFSKERPVNIALWVMQGILAFAFTAAGGMKVLAYEKYRAMLEKGGPITLTHRFIKFLGGC